MSVVALESRAGSGNWLSGLFGLIGRFFSGFYGRVSQSISTIGRSAHLAGEMIRYSVTDSISLRLAGGEVIDQTWRMFKVTALPALLMAVPLFAIYGVGLWVGTHGFRLASEETFRRGAYLVIFLSALISLPLWDVVIGR